MNPTQRQRDDRLTRNEKAPTAEAAFACWYRSVLLISPPLLSPNKAHDSQAGIKMAEPITFVIPGAAIGKGRPKFARRGNFVHTYTPEKTASYENLVKLVASEAMNARHPLKTALQATIDVRVTPPAGWSQKKRLSAVLGEIRPTTKPDADNIAKCILDACNGIAFEDDKQVCELVVKKRYAEVPGVTVTLESA